MEQSIKKRFDTWLKNVKDTELFQELNTMTSEEIENAFFKELSFGTGGLRGLMGAGTNRMNKYTIAKASQGLANYLLEKKKDKKSSLAISYDSRNNSIAFARIAAEVFTANNIKVYMFQELMPTPCLSYAVRAYNADAGIMITASHNAAPYNGYKVYNEKGCQITTTEANIIQSHIINVDIFNDINRGHFENELKKGYIEYIGETVINDYIKDVKSQSLYRFCNKSDLSIVFTPLNGTGLKPVLRILHEKGFKKLTVVKEQEEPDGNFPTCPYPNPEEKEAMLLGMRYAEQRNADILLGTDPDCDRVGIAVKTKHSGYRMLTGNEIGILLVDYICMRRTKLKKMPNNPIFIKTIVSSTLTEKIAESYGVKCINVLNGFKYIGDYICKLEEKESEDSFIFGFEENYGYLSGSYVRDKDGVVGSMLICEMAAYWHSKDIFLIERLRQLYADFGFFYNSLYSYKFEGAKGMRIMNQIMKNLRYIGLPFSENMIIKYLDYQTGIDELPKADILQFCLSDYSTIIIRPSGTEPKLKVYISVCCDSEVNAKNKEKKIFEILDKYILKLQESNRITEIEKG